MKVLTVDDSAVMRQMVKFTLESTGAHACIEAEDGAQAMQLLQHETPDLIISDINMPHMNGYDFVTALRADARFKFTPILMLTTEVNDAAQKRSKEVGATGWLAKPFQPDKLLQVIAKFS